MVNIVTWLIFLWPIRTVIGWYLARQLPLDQPVKATIPIQKMVLVYELLGICEIVATPCRIIGRWLGRLEGFLDA